MSNHFISYPVVYTTLFRLVPAACAPGLYSKQQSIYLIIESFEIRLYSIIYAFEIKLRALFLYAATVSNNWFTEIG